ncbi:uncharacterized protein J7T54_003877 [Emericellopsis cladophorae]|uniref:Mitochondrial pyruvate carrier n=1 Tax=Emericellopsis cladophorae TaxID=2686198 RepID=A0A9Q0BBR4_9HYPO|nr:uncharacterized protein J7T54_003877 [Emericellopsis cladophorae]KAI6778941.1 hypothetical protein J7T54_003877 [Emericellopsis cladophorae]
MASSATSSILRASRPAFRQAFRQQTPFRSQQFYQGGRRWQSSEAGAQQQQAQSWFKKAWESEVGIKTVHFWAPVMKWCLVIAGIADMARPAEKLSFTQNFALTCTGLIWTRWCMIIKPKNILLATVNFFLAMVGIVQLTRIGLYESSKKSAGEAVADVKEEVKHNVKAVKEIKS